MAWFTKYQGGWQSKNIAGTVTISDEDSTPKEIIPIKIRYNSIKVAYRFSGWENPIIGLTAEFSIVNDEEDFFTFMELITATERQFQIVITRTVPTEQVLFRGYIACDNSEQKYLRYQDIKLVGSSYLSKLKYLNAPTVEVLENDTFINIILDCLEQTGSEDDVYVNCSLQPTEDFPKGSTKTLFNLCGVYKEIFFSFYNVDRVHCLDIIKRILTAFDCYIYWWEDNWYIERYADIWQTEQKGVYAQNYVMYSIGTSLGYGPDDEGVYIQTTDDPIEFTDLIKVGANQTIGVTQGMREVEIKIDQQWMANLTLNDFSDINLSPISGSVPYPALRTWQYWETGGYYDWGIALGRNGKPTKNISNSIGRLGHWGIDELYRGLYTRIKVTVDPETSLSIQFKFAVLRPQVSLISEDWSRWDFHFHWYLRHPDGNYYIMYDEEEDIWYEENGTTSEEDALQTTVVAGTEFNSSDLTTTVDISIPLGEVEGLTDSSGGTSTEEFIFGLCTETVVDLEEQYAPYPFEFGVYYGDVVITASSPLEDNHFKGTINTNFLNKTSTTLYFSDVESVNLKSGIWRGTDLDELTTTWEDGEETLPLVDHKIRDKFRLYNISRQKLTATFYTPFIDDSSGGASDTYKPFRCFVDSNQPGKYFVLVAYSYNPIKEEIRVQLMEYDNQETITIA